jgi:hypothetical protein
MHTLAEYKLGKHHAIMGFEPWEGHTFIYQCGFEDGLEFLENENRIAEEQETD